MTCRPAVSTCGSHGCCAVRLLSPLLPGLKDLPLPGDIEKSSREKGVVCLEASAAGSGAMACQRWNVPTSQGLAAQKGLWQQADCMGRGCRRVWVRREHRGLSTSSLRERGSRWNLLRVMEVDHDEGSCGPFAFVCLKSAARLLQHQLALLRQPVAWTGRL